MSNWKIATNGKSIYTAKNRTVCFLPDDHGAQGYKDIRLMSAAPELLSFAKAIGKAIENGDPQEIADLWLGMGRRAINKATGESK